MASVDQAIMTVAARAVMGPHRMRRSIRSFAAHVITALQSVVSRNIDPRGMAVVTVGRSMAAPPPTSSPTASS